MYQTTYHYSDPERENDPHALPDIGIKWFGKGELWRAGEETGGPWIEEDDNEAGFYWVCCFPGCMSDSEYFGPFETEEEAEADALGDDF